MSTFTLQGERDDKTIELTWTDGDLSGDEEAVQFVESLASLYEGAVIASPTDSTVHDHLKNSASAASLMQMAFSGRPVCTYTDIPPVPEPPKGAVM
jgi:hypothetical protein